MEYRMSIVDATEGDLLEDPTGGPVGEPTEAYVPAAPPARSRSPHFASRGCRIGSQRLYRWNGPRVVRPPGHPMAQSNVLRERAATRAVVRVVQRRRDREHRAALAERVTDHRVDVRDPAVVRRPAEQVVHPVVR